MYTARIYETWEIEHVEQNEKLARTFKTLVSNQRDSRRHRFCAGKLWRVVLSFRTKPSALRSCVRGHGLQHQRCKRSEERRVGKEGKRRRAREPWKERPERHNRSGAEQTVTER